MCASSCVNSQTLSLSHPPPTSLFQARRLSSVHLRFHLSRGGDGGPSLVFMKCVSGYFIRHSTACTPAQVRPARWHVTLATLGYRVCSYPHRGYYTALCRSFFSLMWCPRRRHGSIGYPIPSSPVVPVPIRICYYGVVLLRHARFPGSLHLRKLYN